MKKQSSFEIIQEALGFGGIKYVTMENENSKVIIIEGKDKKLIWFMFDKNGVFRRTK